MLACPSSPQRVNDLALRLIAVRQTLEGRLCNETDDRSVRRTLLSNLHIEEPIKEPNYATDHGTALNAVADSCGYASREFETISGFSQSLACIDARAGRQINASSSNVAFWVNDSPDDAGGLVGVRGCSLSSWFACKEINQARIDALKLVFGVPDKRHHADEQQFA